MLPLILSISLAASSTEEITLPKSCEARQEDLSRYYKATIIGLGFLFGGILLLERDHKLAGGFTMGVGTPMAGLGLLGTFEIYEW